MIHNDNDNETNSADLQLMYSQLEHVFMVGTLSLIMAASLIGNIMVCITVYRKRRLRTRTNSFIINLAFADLGVVTLCMPFSLITCLSHHWTLGDVICQLNGLVNIVFTQTSLLTLTAIAIDKYYAIVWPLKRVMTTQRTVGLIVWTWLQPVAIAVIPFAGLFRYQFKPGTTQCGPEFPRTPLQTFYGVFICLIGYFVPLSILGYVYTKIFHSAKQSARRISRVSITSLTRTNLFATHKKVAITIMILVVLLLSCWTPYFVYVMIVIVNPLLAVNRHVLALGKASYWMAFLGSALNPYVYGARNPQFRKEFKLLLCCFCPCLARPLRVKGCTVASSSRGSWEGLGGSNDSNSQEKGGYPCISQRPIFMGYKRRHSSGGWGQERFSNSSNTESNHEDSSNAEVNHTSFSAQRKVSFQLHFEVNLGLDSPMNMEHDDKPSDQRSRICNHSNSQPSRIHSNPLYENNNGCIDGCIIESNTLSPSPPLESPTGTSRTQGSRYKCGWIESAL